MRKLNRPPPKVDVHRDADGTQYVSCGYPFETPDGLLIDFIARAAAMRPDVTFLAERGPGRAWRRLTYARL